MKKHHKRGLEYKILGHRRQGRPRETCMKQASTDVSKQTYLVHGINENDTRQSTTE